MDKTDKHQLVKFIVDFKGMQSISTGILYCAIGAMTYFACASDRPEACAILDEGHLGGGSWVNSSTELEEDCLLSSPYEACEESLLAKWPLFYFTYGLFVVNSVFVWVAFLLVRVLVLSAIFS